MNNHNRDIAAQARQLLALVTTSGLRLALAESCTGGWAAKAITDQPGSSGVLERGFVTYSNQAKSEMLGVSPALIDTHGAVSQEVVEAMALGALAHSQADLAAAVSGIAGPGGGTPEKPVGTVWFAWASTEGKLHSCKHQFAGDRQAIRAQSVITLLAGVQEMLPSPANAT